MAKAKRQSGISSDLLRQQVEERAYALWESQGRLHGHDLDHWLQAEIEINAAQLTSPKSATTRKRATTTTGRRPSKGKSNGASAAAPT